MLLRCMETASLIPAAKIVRLGLGIARPFYVVSARLKGSAGNIASGKSLWLNSSFCENSGTSAVPVMSQNWPLNT